MDTNDTRNWGRTMYKVTKFFISGLLEGMTITETTSVQYEVGFRCDKPCAGSSGYEIVAVERFN